MRGKLVWKNGSVEKAFSSCSNVFSSSYISLITRKINGLEKVMRSDCEQRKCELTVQCEMLTYRNAPWSGLRGPFAMSSALLQYSQQLWALPTVLTSLCKLLMKWLSQVLNSHSHLPFPDMDWRLKAARLMYLSWSPLQSSCHHHHTVTSLRDDDLTSRRLIYFVLSWNRSHLLSLILLFVIIMNLANLTLLGFSRKEENKK